MLHLRRPSAWLDNMFLDLHNMIVLSIYANTPLRTAEIWKKKFASLKNFNH